jgi:hypothetical protein
LWTAAPLNERHDLLTGWLDAVYSDLYETKSELAIKPKRHSYLYSASPWHERDRLLSCSQKRSLRRFHRGLIQICGSGGDGGESINTANKEWVVAIVAGMG